MISRKTIDEIFYRLQVEDIVGDYVDLKKKGTNMLGLCPFHNEKTPSFTVSPAKNIYKCFGCGKGGNGVDFLMEHEGFTYPEALRHIAEKYGIEIEEDRKTEKNQEELQKRDSLFLINKYVLELYEHNLWETREGKNIGLSYLKERGFLEATIRKFQLGYSPDGGANSLYANYESQGFKKEYLHELGLLNKYDKDFFFNRLMFPICNISGKPIAFAGRVLGNAAKTAKYINSPETEIYHKSRTLFGLHLARQAIRKEDYCLVVEGYTDVMALHQNQIENVVASSGTALTEDQVKLIKRYTKNLVLLFDGDAAGYKAAMRGIDIALTQNVNVEIVVLPDKEDPDSYVNKIGYDQFLAYLESEKRDFLHFKAEKLLASAGDQPIKKAEGAKNILASIAVIPDQIKKALYLKSAAKLLDISEETLVDEMNGIINQNLKNAKLKQIRETEQDHKELRKQQTVQKQHNQEDLSGYDIQEKELIRVLLNYGHKDISKDDDTKVAVYLLDGIGALIDYIKSPVHIKILDHYFESLENGYLPTSREFVHHSDAEIKNAAIELMADQYEYSENWMNMWEMPLQAQLPPEINQKIDAKQALLRLKLKIVQELTNEQMEALSNENNLDTSEIEQILEAQKTLLAMRKEILSELNTVVL